MDEEATARERLPQAVRELLAEAKSELTRRTYAKDLKAYFDGLPDEPTFRAFLRQSPAELYLSAAVWRDRMLAAGHQPATVARRFATLRSLLDLACQHGFTILSGRHLPPSAPEEQPATDYAGQSILRLPYGGSKAQLRDTSILRLLICQRLKRIEIHRLTLEDLDLKRGLIRVRTAGRSSRILWLPLRAEARNVLVRYVAVRGLHAGPLFAPRSRPQVSLSPEAIWHIVKDAADRAGIGACTPEMLLAEPIPPRQA